MSEPTYSVVAYFKKDGDVRQVSRFADAAKAKKSVIQSQLTGQHAEIIATGLLLKDVRVLMANYKEDFSIPPGAVAIPGLPDKPKPVRLVKRLGPKITTRTETNEHGEFEIKSTKAYFAPGVKPRK